MVLPYKRNKCVFKHCGNPIKDSKLRFFHFPRCAGERRDQWIRNSGVNLTSYTTNQISTLVVCQLHFTSECFNSTLLTRLTHCAIPTLDGPVTAPPTEISGVISECSAKGCITAEDETCFYFPTNEVQSQLWLKRCGNESLNKLPKKALLRKKVCQKHFANHAFINDERNFLRRDAVPSIFFHNTLVVSNNDLQVSESTAEVPQQENYFPTLPAVGSEDILMEECSSPVSLEANNIEVAEETCNSNEGASPNPTDLQSSNSPLELISKLQQILQNDIEQNLNIENFIQSILQSKTNIEKNQSFANESAGKSRDFVLASCGLPGCSDNLYSDSNTVKKLVKCSSTCKRYFHLQCTGLQKVEYDVLCNNDALRWFCAECRKKS